MTWGGLGIFILGIIIFVCGVGPYTFKHADPIVVININQPFQPPEKNASRPHCVKWHTVRDGENQWIIARTFSQHTDHSRWIKSMRWVSRKSVGDADLKAGESVCVSWEKVV